MRTRSFTALAAAGILALSACGGDPLADDGGGNDAGSGAVAIGSADFPESQLIATIYSLALQDAGVEVSENFNIGSREVYIAAVQDGSIDLVPDYAGALMMHLDSSSDASETDEVLAALDELLPPEGLTRLEAAEAENRNVLAVTQETAADYGLETFSDLEPHASELVLGGPPEWIDRYNGVVGLEEVYGLHFQDFQVLDAGGPLTLTAVTTGQIDVANLFSSDPQVEANDLVVLEDDRSLFAAENIVPILSEGTVTPEIEEALNAVSAVLTTEDLMAMNQRASEGENIGSIAEDWLSSNGLV
ncbi:ABC transporter substrate-binding protein [Sediminivirga luteola]|uniref:Glycine/betaine ABC transporter substrate-binding protein n=1 Tax=Sediminivirga luteola TaxID=1774748 RepID=A0A8J2TV47_9MICO|nr:ABC transporter substrate-binding protein [Sediminivirga luteola]MCI2264666.1 ABC transporter substrate-binding protein [Sediminivirga luteola]GGA02644.1 glycine/betaine ABC transporter substrate-binding protein [Sediminivirga luteola]